jgi:hypothetical protein
MINQQAARRFLCGSVALLGLAVTPIARADFGGAPITFKIDGGWSWFQDPRAIITNNRLVLGSVAGTTVAGGTAQTLGDVAVTSYNLNTQTLSSPFLLINQSDHDDHDVPAFAVLPDGRILTTYENHGGTNNVLWRTSTSPGEATSWSAQHTSAMNPNGDGNGNTYNNPFYLSVPNLVFNSSRSVGYDPNYATFTNLENATPTFTYGGHWMYWQNPGTGGALTGGNGRPYVKYTSNGADAVWFATTEDSPQNFPNSLYSGYIKFNAAGAGSVFTSTGTSLGGLSTSTAPTGNANPPTTGGNTGGDLTSGTGKSYLPTDFTPIVKANQNFNGVNLVGKSVGWASSMQLDQSGDPYLGFVVIDNLNGAYGNDLEYYYAHFNGGAWQVKHVGFAGLPLYNGQNQYAGLMAVDPSDPNKVVISSDVDPVTDAALLGPDGHQHWQILEGTTIDGGSSWTWDQLTDTSSDNIRPVITEGDGEEALLWMQGSYTTYQSFNTNIVGLVEPINAPEPTALGVLGFVSLGSLMRRRRVK